MTGSQDLFHPAVDDSAFPNSKSTKLGLPDAPLDVFKVSLECHQQCDWKTLFSGYKKLKAITFSSSIPALLAVCSLFEEMEIIFGSERVLRHELESLEKATILSGYQFVDAVADQKAVIEHVLRPALKNGGKHLLEGIAQGRYKFSVLRKAPSHEKLYLLEGVDKHRVIIGSANLSLSAFLGNMKETFIVFDDSAAYNTFLSYATRNEDNCDPIPTDLLIIHSPTLANSKPNDSNVNKDLSVASLPIQIEKVPAVRTLESGVVIIEQPRQILTINPSIKAFQEADKLGTELRTMNLEKNSKGATVITAKTFLRAWKTLNTKPLTKDDDEIQSALIDLVSGNVFLNNMVWHEIGRPQDKDLIIQDLLKWDQYMASFESFYGNAKGIQKGYWMLLAWLYSTPFAPMFRILMTQLDKDTFNYPVFGIIYGQSHGGKSHFTRVLVRSMFGIHTEIPGRSFTTTRALGLRKRMIHAPIIVDDLNARKLAEHIPDLVKADRDFDDKYSSILISTNRDVQAIPPELRKRMVVVHIAGSKPRALSKTPAQEAINIGQFLYKEYINRMAPIIQQSLSEAANNSTYNPDLIATSAECIQGIMKDFIGKIAKWATTITFDDVESIKDSHFIEIFNEMAQQNPQNVSIQGNIASVKFPDDINAAMRFEKLVPAQVLRNRFGDTVILDIFAMEKEYGIRPEKQNRKWFYRFFGK